MENFISALIVVGTALVAWGFYVLGSRWYARRLRKEWERKVDQLVLRHNFAKGHIQERLFRGIFDESP